MDRHAAFAPIRRIGGRRGWYSANWLWRVEAYEPDTRLRLAAEMKLPGRAWLEFEVADAEGGSTIRQSAVFDPVGLLGLAHWYGIHPLHDRVFAGMLSAIARRAVTERAVAEGAFHRSPAD